MMILNGNDVWHCDEDYDDLDDDNEEVEFDYDEEG